MGLKKQKNNEKYKIEATLESFKERNAVIKTQDGQTFKWPIKYLPEDLNPGDKVTLKIENEKLDKDKEYQVMRKLLEEMIN